MRGAARGVVVAALALALAAGGAWAGDEPPYFRALRNLDGEQFLEAEPIWFCGEEPGPTSLAGSSVAYTRDYRLLGIEDSGRPVRRDLPVFTRFGAGELTIYLQPGSDPRLRPWPELDFPSGLRAGQYTIHRVGSDSARVVARFRVLRPRGPELAVRAAYSRARRLAGTGELEDREEAARLCQAILDRYPRTSYQTGLYALKWELQTRDWRHPDDGSMFEEMFARFNNSCFGVWALRHFLSSGTARPEALPRVRRLVGLYPDTKIGRAAARYL